MLQQGVNRSRAHLGKRLFWSFWTTFLHPVLFSKICWSFVLIWRTMVDAKPKHQLHAHYQKNQPLPTPREVEGWPGSCEQNLGNRFSCNIHAIDVVCCWHSAKWQKYRIRKRGMVRSQHAWCRWRRCRLPINNTFHYNWYLFNITCYEIWQKYPIPLGIGIDIGCESMECRWRQRHCRLPISTIHWHKFQVACNQGFFEIPVELANLPNISAKLKKIVDANGHPP